MLVDHDLPRPARTRCSAASAVLGGTLTLLDGGHHDVGATECPFVVVLLTRAVAPRHRQVARVGGLISHRRREITGIGHRVACVRADQTRRAI